MRKTHGRPSGLRFAASAALVALGLWASIGGLVAGEADAPCQPLVPEATANVLRAGAPSEAARWAAIRRVWADSRDSLETNIRAALAKKHLPSDMLNLTTYAVQKALVGGERDVVEAILPLWSLTLSEGFSRTTRVPYNYPSPLQREAFVDLAQPTPVSIGPNGRENDLYTSIYLASALDIAATTVSLPRNARPQIAQDFATQVAALARDIYMRWSFGPPLMWQVNGWGCGAGNMDIQTFARLRQSGALGNGRHRHCLAPWSLDVLTGIGIANLLLAHARDPETVPLTARDEQALRAVLSTLAGFFQSRFVFSQTPDGDGRMAPTADFDPGAWRDYDPNDHTANERLVFPQGPAERRDGVGWDVSHGFRIAWMAMLFSRHARELGLPAAWSDIETAFANQFRMKVLAGAPDLPMLHNYLDGSNGWYRVSPDGQGTPPFGLSRALLFYDWAALDRRSPRLREMAGALWRMLAAPSAAQCAHLQDIFVDNYIWKDKAPAAAPLTGSWSINYLAFLATGPGMDGQR